MVILVLQWVMFTLQYCVDKLICDEPTETTIQNQRNSFVQKLFELEEEIFLAPLDKVPCSILVTPSKKNFSEKSSVLESSGGMTSLAKKLGLSSRDPGSQSSPIRRFKISAVAPE